jgi:hypothetical protein
MLNKKFFKNLSKLFGKPLRKLFFQRFLKELLISEICLKKAFKIIRKLIANPFEKLLRKVPFKIPTDSPYLKFSTNRLYNFVLINKTMFALQF